VKVDYYCGSHQYIGNIFTVEVLYGFPANVEPLLTFLISYMDAVGLLVLIPGYSTTIVPSFYHRSFLKHLMEL
jgi:hypothetical protein